MYDTTWWAWLVTVWEVVVYNSVLDLQQCWQVGTPNPGALLWDHATPARSDLARNHKACSIIYRGAPRLHHEQSSCRDSSRQEATRMSRPSDQDINRDTLHAQVVLPVAVLAFAGLKWYHRSRRRRRQREEKQIVRQGSRSQDIRDLNV